jgi:osmotically-inducible protein OsmY
MKSLEGVLTVVNNIEVLPPSSTDDELRRGVYRAIYEDAPLARYAVQALPPIHIIVKNGTVALEGFANSEADRNLAATRASTVANVLSIKNNLLVQPKRTTAQ